MNRIFWTILGTALVVVASTSSARAQADAEFQMWNASFTTVHLEPDNPSLILWLDVHMRRGNAGTLGIVRPGVGVQITDQLSVWAGYAWVPVFPDAELDAVNENHLWQQAILSFPLGAVGLQARARFEQRLLEGGDDLGHRLRLFGRFDWRPNARVPVGVVATNEVFFALNSTDWGAQSGLDLNRFFVGPSFKLSKWARIEPGYLMDYLNRSPNDRIIHAFSVTLFTNFR